MCAPISGTAADGSLGTASINDQDHGPEQRLVAESTNGIVPVGTATVRLSLYGTAWQLAAAAPTVTSTTWSSSFGAVPEPSSMVLAGLGVAAAGLRRRVADVATNP